MSTDPSSTAILQGTCAYCGGFHAGVCHRVKRIVYDPIGRIQEVEFWPSEYGFPTPTVTVSYETCDPPPVVTS